MNALRSILLHVDGSPRVPVRLRAAQALAARHGAALDALYAVTPSMLAQPMTLAEGSSDLLQVLQQVDDERRQATERRVREAGGAVAARWRECRDLMPIPGFVARARFADLMVLGQHEPATAAQAGTPADFVESVLLASGRPGLVLPAFDPPADIGGCVLLAWKPSREAALALAAALPLLAQAKDLHVVGSDEGEQALLAAYLAQHRVTARLHHHAGFSDHSGEMLLSLAADTGADLLVMGCYGHSRTREWVLGGATRTVLQSLTLPVLMAH